MKVNRGQPVFGCMDNAMCSSVRANAKQNRRRMKGQQTGVVVVDRRVRDRRSLVVSCTDFVRAS